MPGDRLPSENELAEMNHVSRITSKKVLEMLAEQGLAQRIPGKGSFVGTSDLESVESPDERRSYKNIGIVMDDINNIFGSEIFLTIERLAEARGCFLIPRIAYGNRNDEEKAIQSLMGHGVDGIILMTSHSEDINPGLMKLVIDEIPLVLIDRFLKVPAPFVGTDNIESTIAATDYLIELGHRNISFLSRPYSNTTTIENRTTGFIKSLAKHNMMIDESKWITTITSIISGCYSKETVRSDINKIKELLVRHSDITCIFATEYNIAALAMKAAEDLKLRVPEDISIICFDGPTDFLNESFFTRVVQMEQKIGTKAFELLSDQIEKHSNLNDQKIFYKAELVVGKSTCKPRCS